MPITRFLPSLRDSSALDISRTAVRGSQCLPSCIAQSGLLSPSHYLEDIIRLSINTFVVVDDDGSSSDFDAVQSVALLWCP